MKDFKGTPLLIGDKVIFTDSFNRLLEGIIVGFSGNFVRVTPIQNAAGHGKVVRSVAVMKVTNTSDGDNDGKERRRDKDDD